MEHAFSSVHTVTAFLSRFAPELHTSTPFNSILNLTPPIGALSRLFELSAYPLFLSRCKYLVAAFYLLTLSSAPRFPVTDLHSPRLDGLRTLYAQRPPPSARGMIYRTACHPFKRLGETRPAGGNFFPDVIRLDFFASVAPTAPAWLADASVFSCASNHYRSRSAKSSSDFTRGQGPC
jgi:hypothetical protein